MNTSEALYKIAIANPWNDAAWDEYYAAAEEEFREREFENGEFPPEDGE